MLMLSRADAIAASPASYVNAVRLLPIGTHVAITGAFVRDDNHAKWMEIHPVTSLRALVK